MHLFKLAEESMELLPQKFLILEAILENFTNSVVTFVHTSFYSVGPVENLSLKKHFAQIIVQFIFF